MVKIALLTIQEPGDASAWSGINAHVFTELKRQYPNSIWIGGLKESRLASFVARGLRKLFGAFGKAYMINRNTFALQGYARQVRQKLKEEQPDVVLALSTLSVAYLRTDKPILIWTDAVFAAMVDYYSEFSNLCRLSLWEGNRAEQQALSKASYAFFSSQWAVDSAVEHYPVDPLRVQLVKFGANLDFLESISPETVQIQESDGINLLFVGVDWQRKNGDFALAVARCMNEAGVATRLHIVGCNPGIRAIDHEIVVHHGFLNKQDKDQANTLKNLYQNAHFFILPSLAECCAVAFAEAFAFGIPAIAVSTGGVAAAISDGINGFLLEPSDPPEVCATLLIETVTCHEKYAQLRSNAHRSYIQVLNWKHAIEPILQKVDRLPRNFAK